MHRKFFVYLDDGDYVYKLAIPAVSEDAAKQLCAGNGEVIAVKDVTEEFQIDAPRVSDALRNAGFRQCEIDFMVRSLLNIGVIE